MDACQTCVQILPQIYIANPVAIPFAPLATLGIGAGAEDALFRPAFVLYLPVAGQGLRKKRPYY